MKLFAVCLVLRNLDMATWIWGDIKIKTMQVIGLPLDCFAGDLELIMFACLLANSTLINSR